MRHSGWAGLVGLWLWAGAGLAAAGVELPEAAPGNDTCAGAQVIQPGALPFLTTTVDVTEATTAGDPPLPTCGYANSRSVWYKFTPTVTDLYEFSTCQASTATTLSFTVLGLYTASGCGGPFTELARNETTNGCDYTSGCGTGQGSTLATYLTAGQAYYLVVWSIYSAAPAAGQGNVQVRAALPTPPANDLCSGAPRLDVGRPRTGSLMAASNNYQLAAASACFPGAGQVANVGLGGDVAYSFTAPADGSYSFRVHGRDPYSGGGLHSYFSNLVLYVASSCPAGPGPAQVNGCLMAANRQDFASDVSEEAECVALSAGQQVYAIVDDNTSRLGDEFVIEAERCRPEGASNGTPAGATTLSWGSPFPASAEIYPTGDVDFYSLVGSPGMRLFALVDGASSNTSDFDLRVTSTTDTLQYDDASADEGYGSSSASVAGLPLPGSGLFSVAYLRVDQKTGVEAGPYRLYTALQPAAGQAIPEVEPNNTTATATAHPSNYFSGTTTAGEDDLFRFAAQAGDLVFVSIDLDPARDATPIAAQLLLAGPSGGTVAQASSSAAGSSAAASPGTLTGTTPYSSSGALVYRVPANGDGVYYLRVHPVGVAYGDYLLSIVRNPLHAKGDLNSSSAPDLLLQHVPTGQLEAWMMTGTSRLGSAVAVSPAPASPDWKVSGIDDFTGDQLEDLALWNQATGAVEFWAMNGATRLGAAIPIANAPTLATNWRLSATGDFDQDGWPDLVWRNVTSQKIVVWTMDGTARQGSLIPTPDQAVDANWEIVAALDFDGDGHRDLLWYNSTSGKIVQWLLDGSLVRTTGRFTSPANAGDNNWKVLAGGDYGVGAGGLPGTNDLVWRNASSGKLVVWHLDLAGNRTFGTFTSPDSPASNPTEWTVAGPR